MIGDRKVYSTVELTYSERFSVADTAKSRTVKVSYPAGHRLKYVPEQQTLIVKSPSGEDVAVFKGYQLVRYITPEVFVEIEADDG